MQRLTLAAALLASSLSLCTQAMPLSDLFGGATLEHEGLAFSNWTLLSSTTTGTAPDLSLIDVVGVGVGTNPGLRYTINGQLDIQGAGFTDLYFSYFLPPAVCGCTSITGAALELTDFEIDGDGMITIIEDVTTFSNSALTSLQVEADPAFSIFTLSDSAVFPAQSGVSVTTNILIAATGNADSTSLNGFEQGFARVPVPATVLLLVLGLGPLLVQHRSGPPHRS